MSWDIFIQHLPSSALTVEDIPDDFMPLALGSRDEVVRTILNVFPESNASDPTWITLVTPHYSIDFGLGCDDPVMSLSLHVGGDESVVAPISELIDLLGARAIDSWTGQFFDRETATESLHRWKAYVDESSQ